MDKVNLTIPEFLSLYTGVLLAESFTTVTDAITKVYGNEDVYTHETIEYGKHFRNYIDSNNSELSGKLEELGPFTKQGDENVMDQINAYCQNFSELIGSDSVEVDSIDFTPDGSFMG